MLKIKNKTNRINSVRGLYDAGLIEFPDIESYRQIESRYDIGLSPNVLAAIKEKSDPVAVQYVPSLKELELTESDLSDPIGDNAHSPVKGIVHRYPDRALLKIADHCAVYCRYCFRREMIGKNADGLSVEDLDNALEYIRSAPHIWEVILTGGDPLILSPRRLKPVFKALEKIEHVKTIRIHSRIPIADPDRITEELLAVLSNVTKPLYMVVHINHAQEITRETERAIADLRQANCVMLSQSVLLKGVNDNVDALESLFRKLIEQGIKPYYLYHPDKANGTGHFRVPLEKGKELMKQLRGRLSGICLPDYMLDIPGGHGKVPVGHDYVGGCEDGIYRVEDYKGNMHDYKDHEGYT
ncbi:MAG: lysine-2,3-aminomutase-like protein [Alphaproteobacteria bacterium]|nr:lysine-2,3-aminomutase-like protein [Alphaproteobacteria bacterium]